MGCKYKVLFLMSLAFLLFPTFSQAITLEEAVNIALKNNLQILLAKEKIKEAEGGVKGAFAAYFPNLSLQGSYTHLGEVPSFSIPFVGEFPMGEQDTTSFTLTLTQPLYTGGKLSLSYDLARLNYQRTKYNLRQIQDELIFEVKKSFYSVLLARENVKIAKQALSQAELHLKIVESFYDSGRASRFDLLRAKVEVDNLKPELIKAKNSLNLAREGLANLLSLPSSSLKVEGELEFEPLILNLDKAIENAFNLRSDLKALMAQKDMASTSLRMTEVMNMPTLSLVGNYQYSDEEGSWEDSWNAGLVLSFNLFDSGRKKASLQQKASQLNQVELAIEQLKEAIELEVKKAFWDMQVAEETIFAQEQNIKQAEEALSIAEARYKNGTITQVEVLDAQLALTRARLNYTRALFDHEIAKAALIKAMGKEKI